MQGPARTTPWRGAVEAYIGAKLPPSPIIPEASPEGRIAREMVADSARTASIAQLADVLTFGLKDLHTIYRHAHEKVGAGATGDSIDRFLSELASRRRMLDGPATIIETAIEDWSDRFHRYVLGFIADADREVGIVARSHGTSPRNAPQARSVDFFRSDPHDDAFGAVALKLASGDIWYYKPRPDTADRAMTHLLEGLGRLFEDRIPICIPQTRAFGDHHWSLHIPPVDIVSEDQLGRAAEHLGAFAAIAYFFNINDLHFENVILSSPIALVDAETIFVATPRGDGPLKDPMLGQADRIAYELVRTGLVPTWQRAAFDSAWDLTPLGSHGEFKLDSFEPDPRGEGWGASVFSNKVTDLALPAEEYGLIVRPAFSKGFRTMFLRIVRSRKEIARLLGDIPQPGSRCILRQTHLYARVLEKSFHPQVLFGLQDRRRFIRQCLDGIDDRRASLPEAVVDYEVSSLDRLSIPKFSADGRATDLAFGHDRQAGFFGESAMAEIERRLKNTTVEDLDVLERCIDMQFKKRFSPRDLQPTAIGRDPSIA